MAAGGNKDAPYIADIFLPRLTAIDKNSNITDLIFYYGSSNIQKAGKIIESRFPQVNFLHGSENCVALLFAYLSKMEDIKVVLITSVRV